MQLVVVLFFLILLIWGIWSLKQIISKKLWALPQRERAHIPAIPGLIVFACFIPVSVLIGVIYTHFGVPAVYLPLLILCGTALFYLIVSLFPSFISLWKRPGSYTVGKSILRGVTSLLLLYPLVILFEGFMTIIVEHLLGYPRVDQDAIAYLLSLASSPILFFFLSLLIVTVIPLMEELLFRGFLQNSLRRFLPSKYALPITAVVFTLFHFSVQQGASNFVILPPLLLLALGLSWVYDKTGSLFSSLAFHSLFNAISILMVLLID